MAPRIDPELERRIERSTHLPIESLDRLSLETRIAEIGAEFHPGEER